MANFDTIKTAIDANINTNGNQAITGAVMNSILKQMVDSTDAELTESERALSETIDANKTETDTKLTELEPKVDNIEYTVEKITEEESRQETHYADYYPLTTGQTVASNGEPTPNPDYNLVTIILEEDELVWTNWKSSLGYTAIGYNGARYRSSDNNLPSSTNPLSVQANTPVYFSCLPQAMGESEIVVQYKLSYKMSNTFAFNDSQKNEVRDEVKSGSSRICRVQYYQGAYGTATEKISIFIPYGDASIRYDITHNITAEKMKDVWRIQYAYLIKGASETPLTINGEWECAFLINGQNDATGGDIHGYEMIQGELLVFVDGILKTPASLKYGENFKELRIVEATYMYKQDSTKVAEHGREYTFGLYGFRLRQSLKFVETLLLDNCYMMMLPAAKLYTDKYYTDVDFAVANISSLPIYKDGAKGFSIFGNDFKADIRIEEYPEFPATLLIHDNGGCSYNKCYFIAAYNKTVQANTKYDSCCTYVISARELSRETHYADYYPLTQGQTVASNGQPTSMDGYDLVTIILERPALLWTNWKSSLGYTAMGYNGVRYRSTENNLPSSSNPLSVQANTPVYFSCVAQAMDESEIVVQYT